MQLIIILALVAVILAFTVMIPVMVAKIIGPVFIFLALLYVVHRATRTRKD